MNLQTWVSLAEIISAFAGTLTLIAVIVIGPAEHAIAKSSRG